MGMSVKGETQHRLVREGAKHLIRRADAVEGCALSEAERQSCEILIRRADLALDRIKKRRATRRAVHVAHLAAMPKAHEDLVDG